MAKKDCTGRLCFEKDFFKASGLEAYQDLVFALTSTKSVVIISRFNFDCLNKNEGENLEFLGNCEIENNYYSFRIPENVDTAIGKGNEYYFSVIERVYDDHTYPMICIHKQSDDTISEDIVSRLDAILSNTEKLFEGIDAWLKEDIDG